MGERFKLDGNTTNEFVVQRSWSVDAVSGESASSSSNPNPIASSVSSQCPTLPSNATDDGSSEDDKIPVSRIGLGVGLGIPLLIALGLLFGENKETPACGSEVRDVLRRVAGRTCALCSFE